MTVLPQDDPLFCQAQTSEKLADLFVEYKTALRLVEKELIKRLIPGQAIQGSKGFVILDREFKDKIKYLGE